MKILIVTGIYPPEIGGPAKYAQNLGEIWGKKGNKVVVKTFGIEHKMPKGISHVWFFFRIVPAVFWCDFIFGLDTSAVGFPAVFASKIFNKKTIIRTGGDRLWEEYVERTGNLVLFKDFYDQSFDNLSKKEKLLFKVTRWTLRNVSALFFSTEWQREIFVKAYDLNTKNISIIENYYGSKVQSFVPKEKNFIAGTRKLKWKNLEILKKSFENIHETNLDLARYSPEQFQKKISECYATILVSLGDISPNMILESIRYNKPFILTQENGLMDRIGSIAITVDPKDPADIEKKVLWLLDPVNYAAQVEKITAFSFTHSWEQIAKEILDLYAKISS